MSCAWSIFNVMGRAAVMLTAAGMALGWPLGAAPIIRPLAVPAEGRPGFALLGAAETGLGFTNFVPEARHLTNQIFFNGSGVTLGDVDGDGRCDVFLAGQGGASALFRNLGDWQFTNSTAGAFPADKLTVSGLRLSSLDATGCAFADFDGDGDLDLVLNSLGQGTHLLFNDGQGHFAARFPAFNAGRGGMTTAIADVDGDGWLDLYLANYRKDGLMDRPNARANFKVVRGRTVVTALDGRPTTDADLTNRFIVNAAGGIEELGEPDVLLRNLGGTNFAVVSWTDGAFLDEAGQPLAEPPFDWGLTAMFRDINGDGRPELYVCNDFETPDRFWLNESKPGQIRFRAMPRGTLRHTSRFSMGLDFADVNRDGRDDFFTLDMISRDHVTRLTQVDDMPSGLANLRFDPAARPQFEANMLQLARGDGTFVEAAAFAGLTAAEWAWSAAFLDVDLDGWEDLLITNGQERAARDADVAKDLQRFRAGGRRSDAEIFEQRRKFPRLAPPNLAFRNEGVPDAVGALRVPRFREVGAEWGFSLPGVSHGLAFGDLDGDGDLDVVVNNFNVPAAVYRNLASAPRVQVRLKGRGGNPHGLGARVKVFASATPGWQSQEFMAGGRYLSGDEAVRTFAAKSPVTVEVHWPAGGVGRVEPVPPNSLVEVAESDAGVAAIQQPPGFAGRVEAVEVPSGNAGDDELARQPLLPRRLGTLGSGVTVADFDGDGHDDVVVPGSAGRALTVLSRRAGQWVTLTNVASPREQVCVLPFGDDWLVAESGYTEPQATGPVVRTLRGGAVAPAAPEVPGPMALTDLEGDGTLELFVGGRVLPGRWPEPATSRIYRRSGNGWSLLQELPRVGLVSGTVFTDLDADGDPDLVLAVEAGPLKSLRNDAGKLVEWDAPLVWPDAMPGTAAAPATLSVLAGFWTSVATGDFDGDGRMDLVAGNWGENSSYELYRETAVRGRMAAVPLVLVHGPLDSDATHDVIEARGVGDDLLPLRSLGQLNAALPWLATAFPTHRAFAQAKLGTILDERAAKAARIELRWFASVLLLNRGDRFEVRPLPDIAQLAPVFGLGVADFNGDGHEDVLLAQNFFGEQFAAVRQDGGREALLLGDGRGGFREGLLMRPQGYLPGEGRGLAIGDLDTDGRPDAVITQHRGALRWVRGELGPPGLRVRLRGAAGNPAAIGAQMRLVTNGKPGPVREVHGGSGYASMDSVVTLFPAPSGPAKLEIRWPGGARTTADLPADARHVEVSSDGSVRVAP